MLEVFDMPCEIAPNKKLLIDKDLSESTVINFLKGFILKSFSIEKL